MIYLHRTVRVLSRRLKWGRRPAATLDALAISFSFGAGAGATCFIISVLPVSSVIVIISPLSPSACRPVLVRRKFIIRMSLLVILSVYVCVLFIELLDLLRFLCPAGSSDLGDDLMVALLAVFLDTFCICRSIQHERIHWSRDLATVFLVVDLFLSLLCRPVDLCFNVSQGNSPIRGHHAQRLRQISEGVSTSFGIPWRSLCLRLG